MRVRYSEDPVEWRKFTWASMAAPTLFAILGAWRGRWSWSMAGGVGSVALVVCLLATFFPDGFRSWYRGGRWFGHQMGRLMGAVLLTLLFVLALVPLALVLRLLGRDVLGIRRNPALKTYWTPARPPGEFSQMF